MDLRTVGAFISGALLMMFCCAAFSGEAACKAPIRIASIDFGESDSDSSNQSVTEFTEALSRDIAETSGLRYSIESVPYARAMRDFSRSHVDLLIASEASVRHTGMKAISLPLFFIELSAYRLATPPGKTDASGPVGILNGMPLPQRYASQHRRPYYTNSYDSLFGMLAARHLDEILVARPRADIYLNNHPDLKPLLAAPTLVERQTVAVHLFPTMGTPCIDRLTASVEKMRGESMTAIAARYLPGVQIAEFLIPSTSPQPGATPLRGSTLSGRHMADGSPTLLARAETLNDPASFLIPALAKAHARD